MHCPHPLNSNSNSDVGILHWKISKYFVSFSSKTIYQAARGNAASISPILCLEIDRYISLAYIIGRYLGFTDISVSAKTDNFIGLSRCWQNTVIFLMHADNLRKKAQRTKSRYLAAINRCVFINKQTRWTSEHASAFAAKTKAPSLIRLIKHHSKILKLLQFEKVLPHKSWFLKFLKKGMT